MTTPASALLSIPLYDYELIEIYTRDTHARRENRKQERHYCKSKREVVRRGRHSVLTASRPGRYDENIVHFL